MKKKILIIVLCLCIISTLCFSLVGCIGTKYDFTKFYTFEPEGEKTISHITRDLDFGSDVISSQYLTGSLYQLQGSYSSYSLYNIVENKKIAQSNNEFYVYSGIVDIVYGYIQDNLNSYYNYYLPSGQLLYKGNSLIRPTIDYYGSENSYIFDFNGYSKQVVLNDYGYNILSSGQTFLRNDEIVGSGESVNSFTNNLETIAGLGKKYSIDIVDSQIIVIKQTKIVSTFNIDSNVTSLAINNGRIFYCEKTEVPDDSEDYDVVLEKQKYKIKYKSFNLKNGKTKEIKLNYVFIDYIDFGNNGDCLIAMKKINKDKSINSQLEYFIANGKGLVANVNKSLALSEDIIALNSKEFLVTTEKGSYITNKYLDVKKDLTQVDVVEVFTNQNIMVAKQTINGTTKYGMIDFKGKVVMAFDYDSYIKGGDGLYFKSNNTNYYQVYNINNIKYGLVRSFADSYATSYLSDDIILSNNSGNAVSIENAFTGATILTDRSLFIKSIEYSEIGKSTIKIYTIDVTSGGSTYKKRLIVIKK